LQREGFVLDAVPCEKEKCVFLYRRHVDMSHTGKAEGKLMRNDVGKL